MQFKIDFATVFLREQVAVADRKLVNSLTESHNALLENKAIDLYDYCVNLWSFADFVRLYRTLRTTRPLEFLVRNWSCNCYFWSLLTRTNQYAESVAEERTPGEAADAKDRALAFKRVKQAIGLLWGVQQRMVWLDLESPFKAEVDKELAKNKGLCAKLRSRALAFAAWVHSKDDTKHTQCAELYATAHDIDVTDVKDRILAAKALMSKSYAHHSFAEYGDAISAARAYEAMGKSHCHPLLVEWERANAMTYKRDVPVRTAEEELALIKRVPDFTKGTAVEQRVLYRRLVSSGH